MLNDLVVGGVIKARFLRALGIDVDEVVELKIDLGKGYDDLPSVTITKIITSADATSFELVLREYELVRKSEPVTPLGTGVVRHPMAPRAAER